MTILLVLLIVAAAGAVVLHQIGEVDVGQNVAELVGGDHHVELLRRAYELHRDRIDHHLLEGDVGSGKTIVAVATGYGWAGLAVGLAFLLFLVLTAVTFSLLGFIIGIWANGFEKLQIVPLLLITPLTFLGGTFYSISVLPPVWQTISLFNPIVYLVSGFRWSFFEISDVGVGLSLGMTVAFLAACLITVWWIFKTGYKIKN